MDPIPSDAVQAEAAAWLVRLQSPHRSPADDHAFQDWVGADLAHAVAFEAMTSTWETTAGLRFESGRRATKMRPLHRRAILTSAAAVVVTGGSIAFWQRAQAETYETDVGEQRHVSLADGTGLFLDTNTRLRIGFSASQRVADLEYGRVNMRIAQDAARPFIVNTEVAQIVAMPSNLDVRRDGRVVSVLLIHGRADVMRPSTQAELLQEGDRMVIDAGGLGRRDRPVLTPLLAWQTGQAIFENGLLSDAVAEMNRYSSLKLTISEAQVGRLRISGIYAVGDNVAFARSVARLLPVKLVQGAGRIEVVADKGRPAPG